MPLLSFPYMFLPQTIISFYKLIFFKFKSNPWGENMVKKAKGAKVKILFQRLQMTRVIFVLVYNLKFCILDTQFSTTC